MQIHKSNSERVTWELKDWNLCKLLYLYLYHYSISWMMIIYMLHIKLWSYLSVELPLVCHFHFNILIFIFVFSFRMHWCMWCLMFNILKIWFFLILILCISEMCTLYQPFKFVLEQNIYMIIKYDIYSTPQYNMRMLYWTGCIPYGVLFSTNERMNEKKLNVYVFITVSTLVRDVITVEVYHFN